MKKLYFHFLAIVCISQTFFAGAQTTSQSYSTWRALDSLLESKNISEALILTDSIRKLATTNRDPQLVVKAKLYLLKIMKDTAATDEDILAAAEGHIKEDRFPYNAIWQSIAASLYRDYYQRHRTMILERPVISREVLVTDIDHWDVNRFYDRIASLYLKSLSRSEELRGYRLRDFSTVLPVEDSSLSKEKTLFDFLVYRVLDFLEDDEKDLTLQQEAFVLDDPNIFAPEGAFVAQKFTTKNLTSYSWLSLQWYKQLLIAHESDSLQDALVYADLCRLDYAYRKSPLAQKKDLFSQALEFIETSYPRCASSGMASVRLAELGMEESNRWTGEYKNTVARLKKVVEKFPGSEAAAASEKLLELLEQRTLSLQYERVVLPNENSKFLLTYRNASRVSVKIVTVPANEYRKRLGTDLNAWCKTLIRRNPVAAYQVSLPGWEDGNEHTTEIKIGGLPVGTYALLATCKQTTGIDTEVLQGGVFQVSSLFALTDLVREGDPKSFMLHRKSGLPYGRVNIFSFAAPDSKKPTEKTKTKKDGSFVLKHNLNDSGMILVAVADRDTLVTEAGMPLADDENANDVKTTFVVPDMAFMPGMDVPFSAVDAVTDKSGRLLHGVRGGKTRVEMRTVGGRLTGTCTLQVNERGYITGKITIPSDAPGGEYTIANESGSCKIQVFDLKTGDWFIETESMRGFWYPGEQIVCRQQVKTFGGKLMEGMRVQYRVVRSLKGFGNPGLSERPGYPEAISDSEILNGSTQTDRDGKFTISFRAVNSKLIPASAGGKYEYTVYTTVYGDDGTVSGHKTVVRSSVSNLQLFAGFPEVLKGGNADTIYLKTTDAEGRVMACNVRMKIEKLTQPVSVFKKRFWQRPDMPLYDSIEFRKMFPRDEFGNESDPAYWQVAELVMDTTLKVVGNGTFTLPPHFQTQQSTYRVTIAARDQKGIESIQQKLWTVAGEYDSGMVGIPLVVTGFEKEFGIGDTSLLNIRTGFDSCHVLVAGRNVAGLFSSMVHCNEKGQIFSHVVSSDDQGGIPVTFFLLKNNRLYERATTYRIKEPKTTSITAVLYRDSASDANGLLKVSLGGNNPSSCDVSAMIYDNLGEVGFAANNMESKPRGPSVSWTQGKFLSVSALQNPIPISPLFVRTVPRFTPDVEGFASGNEIHFGAGRRLLPQSGVLPAGRHGRRRIKKHSLPTTAHLAKGSSVVLSASSESLSAADSLFNIRAMFRPVYLTDRDVESRRRIFRYSVQHPTFGNAASVPVLQTTNSHDSAGNFIFSVNGFGRTGELKYEVSAFDGHSDLIVQGGRIQFPAAVAVSLYGPSRVFVGDTAYYFADIKNATDSSIAVIPAFSSISGYGRDTSVLLDYANDPVVIPAGKSRQVWCRSVVVNSSNSADTLRCVLSLGSARYNVSRSFKVVASDAENPAAVFFTIPAHDSIKQSGMSEQALTLQGRPASKNDIMLTTNPAWFLVSDPDIFRETSVMNTRDLADLYGALGVIRNWTLQSPDLLAALGRQHTLGGWTERRLSPVKTDIRDGSVVMQNLLPDLLARLDRSYLDSVLKVVLARLSLRQAASGEFPWFISSAGGENVTLEVLRSLGTLKTRVKEMDAIADNISRKGVVAMDKEAVKQFLNDQRRGTGCVWNAKDLEYMYVRGFFPELPRSRTLAVAFAHTLQCARSDKRDSSIYHRALLAILCAESGDTISSRDLARLVLASTKKAIHAKGNECTPINKELDEEISLGHLDVILKCLALDPPNSEIVSELKYRMLKNLTSDPVFHTEKLMQNAALLTDWGNTTLSKQPQYTVGTAITQKRVNNRGGDEDFALNRYTYRFDSVNSSSGGVALSFLPQEGQTLYGVTSLRSEPKKPESDTAVMIVTKRLWSSGTGKDQAAQPIDYVHNNLKTGDRVVVRLQLVVKQERSFVNIHDLLPAGLELRSYYAGNRNIGGVGYYQSARGGAVDFYLGQLQKGTYSFDYTVFVTAPGTYVVPGSTVSDVQTLGIITSAKAALLKIGQ